MKYIIIFIETKIIMSINNNTNKIYKYTNNINIYISIYILKVKSNLI